MDTVNIDGVILTELKRIYHPKGDVFHGIKKSDIGYNGFGEAYFSTIVFNDIKLWKMHTRMTLNFIIPVGRIRFVLFDDRDGSSTKGNFLDVMLGEDNYKRITIPPGIWVAFKGINENLNLLLNLADLEHDPNEIVRKSSLLDIDYKW